MEILGKRLQRVVTRTMTNGVGRTQVTHESNTVTGGSQH